MTSYYIQVTSVNRDGKSDPSAPTQEQTIKAQRAPPKIDRKSLGGEEGFVKCRANQQMVLDVKMEGAPPPKTLWIRDGSELNSNDGVRVSHAPNFAKLVFPRADRSLAGSYALRAENQHGKDEVEFELRVVGKPDKPGGPLEVTDVTKKTCKLKWQVSKDDGGSPIQHYEIEKLDPYVDQWIPVGSTKEHSLDVKNLGSGKAYKFLVRAVSREGPSSDLVTEEAVVAKDAFVPPGQPGKPEVCDYGPDFAELRWNTPEEDGGAEITSYRIEVRSGDGGRRGWAAAGTSEESDATVTEHIEQGGEYQFRVVAVNKAGESDHSRASEPITAKQRYSKPKIDKEQLSDTKIHCSQTLRLATNVSGEPSPKVSWWSPTGAKLEDDGEDVTIEGDEDLGRHSLAVRNLTPKDSGLFKVKVKNSEGSCEHGIKVTVLGPPGKPGGPLEVTDVRKTGCRLSWKKPESDGGDQIKSYIVERKRVEQDEWVTCGNVQGQMATVMKEFDLEVNNLLEGEVYMFRVLAASAQGESEPLESFAPTCAGSQTPTPETPAQPRIRDHDKSWAVLEWDKARKDSPEITHYIVERWETFKVPKMEEEEQVEQPEDGESVDDGDGARKKSSSRPPLGGPSAFSGEFQEYCSSWLTALTTDDDDNAVKIMDLAEGHTYKFRLKACNSSGVSGPSEASAEIICRGKKRPVIDRSTAKVVKVSKGDSIQLQVKFSGDPVPERSWHFGKAEIRDAPGITVNDKNHHSKLAVLSADKAKAGQYEFRVSNEFGQETALIDVIVMTAPDKPKGPLRIDEITAESCSCAWKEPEDDGGSLVTHYVLEKATKTSTWTPCGRAQRLACKVAGLTPEKEHRIRVKAVNSEGESDPLVCVEGFVPENSFGAPTAPGRPELVDGDADHFILAWDPPKNDGGSRITGYQLEARKWKETNFFSAGEVKMQLQKGEVSGVELGQAYAARVRAVNAAGPGAWSMETDRMVVKHRALKPRLSFVGSSKETRVKEGESLALEVTIESEPAPEEVVFRTSDGAELRDDGANVRVEMGKGEKARLVVQRVDRLVTMTLTGPGGPNTRKY